MAENAAKGQDLATAILGTLTALVCVLDRKGRVHVFNRACERATGYTLDELRGRPLWDTLIPPDEQSAVRKVFKRLCNGETTIEVENHWLTKSGEKRLISWSNTILKRPSGRVQYVIGTGVDITEQRRAEEEARESGARLDAVLNASADGVITIDEAGQISSFSQGAERLFGYADDDVIGKNVQILMPAPYREEHDGYIERYIRTGEKRIIGIGREVSAQHKDGTIFPIRLSVDEVMLDGLRFFTGVVHDITERKRLETIQASHQEALERLAGGARLDHVLGVLAKTAERVLPNMFCSIFLLDRQSRRLRLRAGPSLPSFFNDGVDGASIGPDAPCFAAACHIRKRIVTHDIYASDRDQGWRDLAQKAGLRACWAEPILSTMGEVLGVCAMYYRESRAPTDAELKFVSEQARLAAIAIERAREQDQLRHAHKMESIGRLTGGIAHDFNNLLTVIRGNLEMLEARIDDPKQRNMLEQAQQATELGAQLAHQLLAFARRQPLKLGVVDMNALVLDMTQLLRRTLGESIRVTTSLANDLWSTRADPVQLQNTLLNLALNARDAMPSGGTLAIDTGNATLDDEVILQHGDGPSGEFVRVTVSDNGPGMPDDVRDKIFEPFFTTKEAGAGVGLGLSMVYGFVKQCGGHVFVYSEPGQGTTINLYFPRDASEPGHARAEAASPEPERGTETILVVEDDARVRRVACARLADLGYNIVEVSDGRAALQITDEGAVYDLLFTDLIMPGGMNGGQLAQEARKRRPDLKVLFTSGYADPAIIEEGVLDEGGAFLRKPYSQAELAQKVREALECASSSKIQ